MENVTIIYQKGIEQNDRGVYRKDGVVFRAKETVHEWTLSSVDHPVKIELKWSKKDLPTFDEWHIELTNNGFEN